MEPHTIRFPTDVWAAAQIAAKHKGESIAEYIRTALVSRCAYDAARRDDRLSEAFDRLWTAGGLADAALALREEYDLDEPLGGER